MKILISATLLSALLLWAGCSTTPRNQVYNDPSPAPTPVTALPKPKKDLVFPKSIAGIPFSNLEVYEAEHPGYGVGYLYENGETLLDISVFDRGKPVIQDGINSEEVHFQYEEAKQQIAAVEERGYYRIKEVISDDWIRVGYQPFLYFSYKYDDGRHEKSSYLMLTAYDGNFLKIRLTTDLTSDTQVFKAFMSEFEALISSETAS